LAGLAIHATGQSMRPDVKKRLEELKDSDFSTLEYIRTSLATAAFRHDVALKEGPEQLLQYQLSGEGLFIRFQRWLNESENGRDWWQWNTNIAAQIHATRSKDQ